MGPPHMGVSLSDGSIWGTGQNLQRSCQTVFSFAGSRLRGLAPRSE
jgi:hypothetical protein